jgi:O-antigen ligase
MRIKTRINRNELLFFLLGLPYMNPDYLAQLDYIGNIIDVLRVCSFIVVIILILPSKKALSNVACIIIVSQVFIVANTIYHGGALHRSLTDAFGIISVVLFYEYAIKKDITSFVKSQLLCFEIVIYINLLTILMFPSGLYIEDPYNSLFIAYKCWFLGYYNRYTRYFLPAIAFSFINKYWGGSKRRTYLLFGAIVISSILVWSGGVLMAVFATFIFILLEEKYKDVFNYVNYWLIQPLVLIMVLAIQIQNNFRWLLDTILGKWSSLMGRINLWRITCGQISSSIIIGYGMKTGLERSMEVGFNWGTYAHNMILETLYRGGLVYFTLFFSMIYLCGKKLKKNRNEFVVVVISAVFGGWSVHSVVESYTTPFLMGLFIVGYYSDRIINAGANSNIYGYVTAKLREVEKGMKDD